MPDEFDLIGKYFQPISGEGSLALKDDVAWLRGAGLVISKDVLVAGTHFFPTDPIDLVARKALRVNLSDIIAKGASPTGYFLGCVFPAEMAEHDIKRMVEGLETDQTQYGLPLLGGDTTAHQDNGPLTLSITMLGKPVGEVPVRRNGGQAGDLLFVSGTIGDAGLGLDLRLGKLSPAFDKDDYLQNRYLLPEPPQKLAPVLAEFATASLDVSDGLMADATHLAKASGLSIRVDAEKIPLSAAASQWLQQAEDRGSALARLVSAGDDYQVLCTVPADKAGRFTKAASEAAVKVAQIGHCQESHQDDASARLIDRAGKEIILPSKGYTHF